MRMPALTSVTLAGLLALLAALPAPARPRAQAAPNDPQVWVTIGTTELAGLEEFLGRERLAALVTVLEGNDVARLGRMRESRLGELAAAMHARFRRCGGFTTHPTRARALAALDAAERPPAPEAVAYTIDNGPTVRGLIAPMAADNVRATIQHLSSYSTRFYNTATGVQAAQWLAALWQGYAAGRGDVRVFLWPHTWAQPSVVAQIQGTQFPNEAVVIGGHLDSTSYSGNAPGADDDASGVASLTETFRAAMATGYRPARSVFFMAYAAEEVGLRGSEEIAGRFAPLTARIRFVGKLQLDMTNYKGSAVDFGILPDSYTSVAQNQFLRDLIATYSTDIVPGGATQDSSTQCDYACSDHASWGLLGFPSSIAFESRFDDYNPYIHSPNDTLANSDPTAGHAVKFSRLGAAYMAELAKGSLPPPGPVDTAPQR